MKNKVFIAIIALVLIVAVTAFLNKDSLGDKKKMQDEAIVALKSSDNEATFNITEIKQLGEKEFSANLKSSGKEAEQHKYTGVPLKNVFGHANISLEGKEQIIVKAVDGYTVALMVDEVLDDDNVYLAYEMDGEPFGKKEDGGKGPYQVIIRKDQFSQRWCKFVTEIEVK